MGLSYVVQDRLLSEQIMDIHYTLCVFAVPLDGPAWLIGANQSVITSSTIPIHNWERATMD
jgi:hypothetical protein